MKIGCPNHPRQDLLDEVRWIGTHGFDFLDLFIEPDKALPEIVDVTLLKQTLQEYRLSLIGHSAWYLPFGSPYRALRETAVEIVSGYFPFLQELACPFLTVHANWPSGLFSEQEAIDFQLFSLERLIEKAAAFDVRIMYEPLGTPSDTLENLKQIVSRLPDLMVHLDMGHAHVCKIRPELFFKAFPGKVAHIHLHDNDGCTDQHLPLGEGTIPWDRTIGEIRRYYDDTITLEIFTGDRDYLLSSRKKLVQYWKEAGQGDGGNSSR